MNDDTNNTLLSVYELDSFITPMWVTLAWILLGNWIKEWFAQVMEVSSDVEQSV